MDVAPDIDSVELSVRAASDRKKGIRVRREGEILEIRVGKSDEPVATIELAKDEPKLFMTPWHGHFESGEELTHALLMLLGGCASIVEEFRGSECTAMLRFSYDGDAWLIDNVSYYVDPYDREGWQLKHGEQWSWVFTTRKYIDASADFRARYPDGRLDRRGLPPKLRLGKRRIIRTEPLIWQQSDCFAWYERRFEKPLPGLRWTESNAERFIYQVPTAWSEVEIDAEGLVTGHRSPDAASEIHVRSWSRETDACAVPSGEVKPVKYKEREVHERTLDEGGAAWAETLWVLTFTNGEEDLLTWFTFRSKVGESNSVDHLLLKARLDEALKVAAFAPPPDGTRGSVTWDPG